MKEYICCICKKKVSLVDEYSLNAFDGYCESSISVKLCFECSDRHSYLNEHYYSFLHYEKHLYVASPNGLYYNRVYKQEQIDEAFNPDYAAFKEWEDKFDR